MLDLGLIYDVQLNKGQIYVKMTLTAPGCGMGPYIAQNAEWRIAEIEALRTWRWRWCLTLRGTRR